MKTLLHPTFFAVATLVAIAVQLGHLSFAQSPAQSPDDPFGAAAGFRNPPVPVEATDPTLFVPTPNDPFGGPTFARVQLTRAGGPPLQQLAAAVRAAKDDAARTTAQEALRKQLHATFDADMQRREQELTKLEERIEALRQQATRRQAKKEEIIELQTRVLLNEADGLGFYSGGERNSQFGGFNWSDGGEMAGGMPPAGVFQTAPLAAPAEEAAPSDRSDLAPPAREAAPAANAAPSAPAAAPSVDRVR